MTRLLSPIALIALLALAGGTTAQTSLTEPQARALNCAAMFYLASAEFEKAGLFNATQKAESQKLALAILRTLPGGRRQQNALLNAQSKALAQGKTPRRLFQEFQKVVDPCLDEFVP